MQKKIVSEYKQKQMKLTSKLQRNTVTVFVAIVVSLCLCTFGVVAAINSYTFDFANAIAVSIDKVEGSLSASRSGGIYASGANAGNAMPTFSGSLYTTATGTSSNLTSINNDCVNVNYNYKTITYVFSFVEDSGAGSNTKITLSYADLNSSSGHLSTSYKYILSASSIASPSFSTATTLGRGNASAITVNQAKRYCYIEIKLTLNADNTTAIVVENTPWSFGLNFEGSV